MCSVRSGSGEEPAESVPAPGHAARICACLEPRKPLLTIRGSDPHRSSVAAASATAKKSLAGFSIIQSLTRVSAFVPHCTSKWPSSPRLATAAYAPCLTADHRRHELERRANALSQRSSETTLASALVGACAVAACNATFWQVRAFLCQIRMLPLPYSCQPFVCLLFFRSPLRTLRQRGLHSQQAGLAT